jgi:hypothetical protein
MRTPQITCCVAQFPSLLWRGSCSHQSPSGAGELTAPTLERHWHSGRHGAEPEPDGRSQLLFSRVLAPSPSRQLTVFVEADPPEMVCEIHIVDGPDGERLARQQAEALWEVTQWLAQNKSRRGQQQTN